MATWDAEIREESVPEVMDDSDTVYVAVGKDVEESKLTLTWALQNFPRNKICILHVHQPSKMIPLSKSMYITWLHL